MLTKVVVQRIMKMCCVPQIEAAAWVLMKRMIDIFEATEIKLQKYSNFY
jgi:hypothetical protein